MAKSALLKSSIAKKVAMALSGLFLILFLLALWFDIYYFSSDIGRFVGNQKTDQICHFLRFPKTVHRNHLFQFIFVEILGQRHQLREQLLDAQRSAVIRLDHLLKAVEEILATRVQADQIVQLALDQGPELLRLDVLRIVEQLGASNPVSHMSRTITILSPSARSLNRLSSRFFCPLLKSWS